MDNTLKEITICSLIACGGLSQGIGIVLERDLGYESRVLFDSIIHGH